MSQTRSGADALQQQPVADTRHSCHHTCRPSCASDGGTPCDRKGKTLHGQWRKSCVPPRRAGMLPRYKGVKATVIK